MSLVDDNELKRHVNEYIIDIGHEDFIGGDKNLEFEDFWGLKHCSLCTYISIEPLVVSAAGPPVLALGVVI
jgi:hypothetical protein